MSLKEFKRMVFPYKDKLYRFALSIVGNNADAEDVVQEIFIKLWDRQAQVREIQNLEAWLMRLTKNLSIDKLRSKHRRAQNLEVVSNQQASTVDPHEWTEQRDTIGHIQEVIRQLPEKQRMIIQLRDIEEMSYQEISDILEIPMSQVKVYLFRARQHIRTQLLKSESYGL
jgi:RNA polymerase sigma-70 factor (family 1)